MAISDLLGDVPFSIEKGEAGIAGETGYIAFMMISMVRTGSRHLALRVLWGSIEFRDTNRFACFEAKALSVVVLQVLDGGLSTEGGVGSDVVVASCEDLVVAIVLFDGGGLGGGLVAFLRPGSLTSLDVGVLIRTSRLDELHGDSAFVEKLFTDASELGAVIDLHVTHLDREGVEELLEGGSRTGCRGAGCDPGLGELCDRIVGSELIQDGSRKVAQMQGVELHHFAASGGAMVLRAPGSMDPVLRLRPAYSEAARMYR